jgi:hypothetical protein
MPQEAHRGVTIRVQRYVVEARSLREDLDRRGYDAGAATDAGPVQQRRPGN